MCDQLKNKLYLRPNEKYRITEIIEDLIDGMEAEASREEGIYYPLDEVLEKQDKKRGIKDGQFTTSYQQACSFSLDKASYTAF